MIRSATVGAVVVLLAVTVCWAERITEPDTDIGNVYPDQVPGGPSGPDVSVPGDNGEEVEGCYTVELNCLASSTTPGAAIVVELINSDPGKNTIVEIDPHEEPNPEFVCEWTEVHINYHPGGPPDPGPPEPTPRAGWGVTWSPN